MERRRDQERYPLDTQVVRAFNRAPRNRDWRRRRREIYEAQRAAVGVFDLARYPGGIEWL